MSSISKAPSSIDIPSESPEESGWTMYFEDFCNNDNDDDKCFMSSDFASSSLVSDAASLMAAKKLASADRVLQAQEFAADKNGNRSSFKKRKQTKAALVDDPLEDTASSPVNSPKVLYAKQSDKPKQKEEVDLSEQEKGSTSGKGDERKELGFNGRKNDRTELKKRGLCLIPLSMVVNFLG